MTTTTTAARRVATETLLEGPVTLRREGPADPVSEMPRESFDDHLLRVGPRPEVSAALLADITEGRVAGSDGEEENQSAQAGGYFGWWNLVAKLNLALAAGLSLPLLDLAGYRPGDFTATAGLSAVYCLLPLFFKTIAAVLAWRWRKILESSS